MANKSYPKGMEKLLQGAIDCTSDTLKVTLVPTAYTFSTAHEFLSDLGTTVGTDQELAGVSVTGGVLDADDPDFDAIASGSTLKALVLYKDTGNASTSPLLLYIDTITGFPLATSGAGVSIPWDDGAKRIARMGLPFYPLGAEKVLSGGVNFLTAPLRVALLPSSYVYSAAHEFLDDVGTLVGTAQALTSVSVANGVFDAADAAFGSPASGSTVGSAIMYVEGADATDSPLLMHITDVVGFPAGTTGGAFSLIWSNGAARIFSLASA
ncbi:hypothetical protein [Ottowia sp. VDI28]|uniref:hypothetical protein n=1 Tax=Ottowia sp. VDI28 TaxID=3133968 RepID=UPI003C2C618D